MSCHSSFHLFCCFITFCFISVHFLHFSIIHFVCLWNIFNNKPFQIYVVTLIDTNKALWQCSSALEHWFFNKTITNLDSFSNIVSFIWDVQFLLWKFQEATWIYFNPSSYIYKWGLPSNIIMNNLDRKVVTEGEKNLLFFVLIL